MLSAASCMLRLYSGLRGESRSELLIPIQASSEVVCAETGTFISYICYYHEAPTRVSAMHKASTLCT